ncbi:u5 small nuclear ribonucleoprotein 40 kda [Plasmopara halstedii]|uniref:U5 small nuclear ribonucleoprotein 40 kDa n=1 Tax=Plasmopara halstedii TaxID=4781 RepID=A0A0P1B1U5_PLAHL|nr:u5 small nuclear ribonucleoprotein 40 kda [Plasmopara halstedii]CEG47975.1 u5 small nuclear ribonucleoprotein 40 kda [Plasmopara halstedii]|eukprot:XP_024584344.1 u5 small nuclear ribonucleoprotein 40 kda [Plasmopara halstedii]
MGGKRRLSSIEDETSSAALTLAGKTDLIKRTRITDIVTADSAVVASKRVEDRASGLLAPTMLLSGHSAAVYSLKFSPTGQHAATGSFDRSILLWDVYGECRNYSMLSGHKNAVLEVQWTYDGTQVVSASADKMVGLWDAESGRRIKKFTGHSSVVNSCCPVNSGPTLIVSSSDDCSFKVWDVRYKRAVKTFENKFQVTAVCFSGDNSHIIAGGLDGDIKIWDLRNDDISTVLQGHVDIVTSVSLSPDGTHLLSNAMDSTVRKWDVRPFVTGERLKTTFMGAKHSFDRTLIRCGWSADMRFVSSGSADRYVYIWDAESGNLRYKLPGHTGSVNEATFHPTEPIVGSCSSDKNVYLGELTEL